MRYFSNLTFTPKLRSAFVLTALLAAGMSFTDRASACGGLFCSAANPVNQAAERIIFAQGDGMVDAIIEIQYEGPSEQFAWVLPVPAGDVTVGVSSKQALDALQQQSNPLYQLNPVFENCNVDGVTDPATGTPVSPGPSAPDDSAGPGVMVVGAGTVGPYDYVQLSVDESLPDAADVAVNWLEENGYDVTNIGTELLGPYLEDGLDLIAFRLTKGNDSGSIRPVQLTYAAENPFIPIKPTAVAANDDMGVMVWVLADARAIPSNYLHLEVNEAKINWFNPGPTYNDVIIAAADEAGGQGFVTEQSGASSAFRENLYPSWKADAFEYLETGQFGSLEDFFATAINFATTFDPITGEQELYDGFMDVMSDPEVVPLREGATPDQFVSCVSCYFQVDVPVRNAAYPETPYDPVNDPILTMSITAFLDALEASVVTPLTDTQALFDQHSTVTRFYTTLSADEMTIDPVFDFNADLEPVDNVHVGEQLFRCDGSQQITLPQGMVLETDGATWPVTIDDELPMNFRILQLSTSGLGDVARDNTGDIATLLADLGIGSLDAAEAPVDDDDDDVTLGDDDTTDDDTTDDDDGDDTGADDDDTGADDDDTGANDDDDTGADDDDEASGDGGADSDPSVREATTSADGCGCRVIAKSDATHGAWALLLPLAAMLRRRRRVR